MTLFQRSQNRAARHRRFNLDYLFWVVLVAVGVVQTGLAYAGDQASVGGTISGLGEGQAHVLRLALEDEADGHHQLLTLDDTADGNLYSFPESRPVGSSYRVRVVSAPANRRCTVDNAEGTVPPGGVMDADVSCQPLPRVASRNIGLHSGHFLAIDVHGRLWGWGSRDTTGLLPGLEDDRAHPNPTRLGALEARWAEVSLGARHGAGIQADGTLWTWGMNCSSDGQHCGSLGLGLDTAHSDAPLLPTQVGSDQDWIAVQSGAAGSATNRNGFSLALKADGTLWAWGDNRHGQLGLGDTTDRSAPTRVGEDDDWVMIRVRRDHVLALKADGTLWAWGSNHHGQLGLGDTDERFTPTRVGEDDDWARVSVGLESSFGIRQDGSLWAWGRNDFGQLGIGDQDDRWTPVSVDTEHEWMGIQDRGLLIVAVRADGSLWTWGRHPSGHRSIGLSDDQLDNHCDPDTGICTTPLRLEQAGTDWLAADISDTYAVFGIRPDGRILAFGYDGYLYDEGFSATRHGQLGCTPDGVRLGLYCKGMPVFTATPFSSGGLLQTGQLAVWGQNNNQQLGLGDSEDRNVPVRHPATEGWAMVSINLQHALGIRSDGSLWGWGSNTLGELGLGEVGGSYPTPIRIGEANDWHRVWASWDLEGGRFSLALKEDGTLWAWGRSASGALGLGQATPPGCEDLGGDYVCATPQQVGSDDDWQAISVLENFVLGLKTDGTLWAWGNNLSGQLGLGDTNWRWTPTQVGSDDDWTIISAGGAHSLALKAGGTLWAWGSNSSGQLGMGDTDRRETPTQVGTANDWVAIAAGTRSSFAQRKADPDDDWWFLHPVELWAWGFNGLHSLGLGPDSAGQYTTPQRVTLDGDTTAPAEWSFRASRYGWQETGGGSLAAWTSVGFAITADGTPHSWGNNNYGGLGQGLDIGWDIESPWPAPLAEIEVMPPERLEFAVEPVDTVVGTIIAEVVVHVLDKNDNRITWDNETEISLALETHPDGAILSGTLSAQVNDGVAVFDDLSIDTVGEGYRLRAVDGQDQLETALSESFRILEPGIFKDRFEAP